MTFSFDFIYISLKIYFFCWLYRQEARDISVHVWNTWQESERTFSGMKGKWKLSLAILHRDCSKSGMTAAQNHVKYSTVRILSLCLTKEASLNLNKFCNLYQTVLPPIVCLCHTCLADWRHALKDCTVVRSKSTEKNSKRQYNMQYLEIQLHVFSSPQMLSFCFYEWFAHVTECNENRLIIYVPYHNRLKMQAYLWTILGRRRYVVWR